MSISTSPVQEKASNAWSAGTSFTISGFTTPTNGNLLVIYFSSSVAASGVSSITQTGATWVSGSVLTTSRNVSVWYAENVSGAGTTITINLNYTPGSPGTQSACLSEWSGVATSSSLDANATNNAGSGTTVASPSLTPTASRNVLIIAGMRSGGAVSAGPDGGFTALTSADASVRCFGAYRVETTTSGSYQTNWTQSANAWGVAMASFLAPGGGGSPKNPPPGFLSPLAL